jgi:hypothetical protein
MDSNVVITNKNNKPERKKYVLKNENSNALKKFLILFYI